MEVKGTIEKRKECDAIGMQVPANFPELLKGRRLSARNYSEQSGKKKADSAEESEEKDGLSVRPCGRKVSCDQMLNYNSTCEISHGSESKRN